MNNQSQAANLKKEILVRLIKAYYQAQNFEEFEANARLIPFDMRPKDMEVPYRCCIYKERAILKDRAIAGLGFAIEDDDERKSLSNYAHEALMREKIDDKHLTVLQAACKGCATGDIYVTDLCQGCVARPCLTTCKFGAVSIVDGKSKIDSSKCKKCQMCINVCPYKAIVKRTVPCEDACPVGAIKKDETERAFIDFEKCISCGKCIAACPFGAVHEKSQIIDILKSISNKDKTGKKIVALIAPSIAGQFPATIYQIKSAILKLGFDDVIEVALGADITANNEAREFKERMEKGEKFMTTSCCAGYNQLIKKHLPEIKPFVSDTKTPLYYTAEIAKEKYPNSVTVFVSPCVAKRVEGFDDKNVDYVMSFEELGAMFVAKKIEIMELDETKYEVESSKQGRNFGVSGGVAASVKDSLNASNNVKPCLINGLNKASIKDLKNYATKGECPDCNLIEVMCCYGGCIGGNATVNSEKSAKKLIDTLLQNSEEIKKID